MGVNLITPVHTMNEQSVVIPGGTYANTAALAEAIPARLCGLFGWELTGDGKAAAARNAGVCFTATSSSSSCSIRAMNSAGASVSSPAMLSANNPITIFWHVSSDEKTMYLSVRNANGSMGASFILAENGSGEITVFAATSDGQGFSEKSPSSACLFPFHATASNQPVGTNFHYSVSEFPDLINGGRLGSLYRVNSVKYILLRDQLVQFGDTVFRLTYLDHNSNSYLWFAFPVSEQ